ncbi:MAG: hypothetical protein ABL895_14230 [Cyclobacteriaceae bacterium]
MTPSKLFIWLGRFIALLILFFICYLGGAMFLTGKLPDTKSEPGLVPFNIGLLVVGITNTLLVIALVLSSRWSGRYLELLLAAAYYGVVTFVMQIETWYFLSDITVNSHQLPYLFFMGLPVAFLFVPLSVLILGKGHKQEEVNFKPFVMPVRQWVWKLSCLAVAYMLLYWLAGYYIAWQNPELRAFYGSPGSITPFWQHTANTLRSDPGLFPFQIVRSMIWVLCALPVIYGSRVNVWMTALLVGTFFSTPQNLGHIMENPLLPLASVRLSHLIETASSTFVFGLIVVWLLHREHRSFKDLFMLSQSDSHG